MKVEGQRKRETWGHCKQDAVYRHGHRQLLNSLNTSSVLLKYQHRRSVRPFPQVQESFLFYETQEFHLHFDGRNLVPIFRLSLTSCPPKRPCSSGRQLPTGQGSLGGGLLFWLQTATTCVQNSFSLWYQCWGSGYELFLVVLTLNVADFRTCHKCERVRKTEICLVCKLISETKPYAFNPPSAICQIYLMPHKHT